MSDDHEARIAELEYEVHNLQVWRSQAENEVATLRTRLEEMRNLIRRVEQSVRSVETQVAVAERQLADKIQDHEGRLSRLGSNW